MDARHRHDLAFVGFDLEETMFGKHPSRRLKRKPPAAVGFLSDYSLGIYCLPIYMFSTVLLNLYKLHSAFVLFGSRVIDSALLTKLMRKSRLLTRFV